MQSNTYLNRKQHYNVKRENLDSKWCRSLVAFSHLKYSLLFLIVFRLRQNSTLAPFADQFLSEEISGNEV